MSLSRAPGPGVDPRHGEGSIAAAEVVPICLLAVLAVSSHTVPAFYHALGRNYPEGLSGLESLAWASGVWAWLYAYAARRRIALPLDAGWFVILAWWMVVPYYLFRTRGRRAWIPLFAFAITWGAAYILAMVIRTVAS